MASSTTDRRLGLTGATAFKTPCKAATTAAITLSGEQTVDSVAVVTGDRVLVKNQSTASTNGIYVVDTGSWTRDLDFDGTNDFRCGTLVFVTNGSTNGAGLFQLTSADPLTIDSSSLSFTKIATLSASSVTQVNVQNGQFFEVGSIAGTNTITGTTVGTAPSANGHGQFIFFVPANTNTGAATFNRDSLGALNIFYNGAALIGGELVQNIPALLFEDGTQYQLIATASSDTNYRTMGSVTAAATLNLDTAKPYSQVTGTTGVTAVTLGNGRVRFLEFAGSVQFTASASLILNNGGSNVTTAAGDTAIAFGESGGVVRIVFTRASGNTVSGSSLVVRSQLAGLTMSTAGSSATLTVAAGQATDSTNVQSMSLGSSMAKTTSAWSSGTGNGGLDTGAIGTSTWYHWYLIYRPDTGVADIIFSLSASTPTLPANYTYYRRIGAAKTNGSSQWILFKQYGDEFYWDVPLQDINASNPGTSAVLRTLTVPTGLNLPVIINANVRMGTSTTIHVLITNPDETDSTPSSSLYTIRVNSGSGAITGNSSNRFITNTSAQIRSRFDTSSTNDEIGILTYGWVDRRGRDS